MRLAASHIGWSGEHGAEVLRVLAGCGFNGLEIAPAIAVDEDPYGRPQAAAEYARAAAREHGLALCSMQGIWYGQVGSMFGGQRDFLLDYTKRAILFAEAGGIGNIVFGCPKNRVLPQGASPGDALPFFRELGDFAAAHGTVLALEATPEIYGTNFVNRTEEAFEMAAAVGSAGFKVNLDVGTMLQNGEGIGCLEGRAAMINHVHVSEPQLAPIAPRTLHGRLAALLRGEGYAGYVSAEQKPQPPDVWRRTAEYMAEVFA